MKRISLILTVVIALLGFNSCSDSNTDNGNPASSGPDYLVMFYAVGGGNLDTCIVANIAQAIDEGAADNVKMTFQYKASAPVQKDASLSNFDGVRRFTCEDNEHLKGKFKSISPKYPFLDKASFQHYVKELRSERIGGVDFDMSKNESLADFIKWSKSKYPDAKRTILVLSDHGGGWDLSIDGKSRAILRDDNIKDNIMTAKNVVDGVNKGGGIDLLYTDACLMAMYENLYTYAKAIRYLLAGVELTLGDGGDYRKLLSLLKSAGTSDSQLESAMCAYTDYCTSPAWWARPGAESPWSDIGFYDLSKLGNVTTALKKVSSTLAVKFVSDESIQPASVFQAYGTRFDGYIRKSVMSCVVSCALDDYDVNRIPKTILPYLEKDGIKPYPVEGMPGLYVKGEKLIEWVKSDDSENAREARDKYPDDWKKLTLAIIYDANNSYSITDIMRNMDNELTAVAAQNNPFSQLRRELLDAIKSMAHISCASAKEVIGVDQAYELCSPGVVIVPFNEHYADAENYLYTVIPNYQDALNYYLASDFDTQVGWSKFLRVIDIQPCVIHNPWRSEIK